MHHNAIYLFANKKVELTFAGYSHRHVGWLYPDTVENTFRISGPEYVREIKPLDLVVDGNAITSIRLCPNDDHHWGYATNT